MKPEYTKDEEGNPIKVEKVDIKAVLEEKKEERTAIVNTLADYETQQKMLDNEKAFSGEALIEIDKQIAEIESTFKSEITSPAEAVSAETLEVNP